MNRAHSGLHPSILYHRVLTQQRPAQPGQSTRTRPRTQTALRLPRVQPARLRFACYRRRHGRWGIHNPECRHTDLHLTNQAGIQGKPGKALSPNCQGGSFPGRRQTAATPHAPPSGRAAANRTQPAETRPPHSCERLTCPRPAVPTPDGAGRVPRFSPGLVHVSRSAPRPSLAGRSLQNDENARTNQDAQRARAGDLRRVSPDRRPRHRQCRFSAGGAER